MLGTLKFDADRTPSAGDIGIQDQAQFPQDYMAQLALPFKGTLEQKHYRGALPLVGLKRRPDRPSVRYVRERSRLNF